MNNTIVESINSRKRISITYNGAERLVEPHTYGTDSSGASKLRGYQISDDPAHSGWRLFSEDKITEVKASQESFPNPKDGYKKDDAHIKVVFAQL
jgi:hypothetical protein